MMKFARKFSLPICISIAVSGVTLLPQAAPQEDPVKGLVARLDPEKYKATIKGLAEFGDRQQGTERNRKAVDWIKGQLQSYGCLTDRVRYSHPSGTREQVFCTKVGTTSSEEMYIVGAHMDGQGGGEAADDNASGTAAVMELARVFSMSDVQTDRSIRFVLWNHGEIGDEGVLAYINQRMDMQGKEDYPGSGNYPESRWLGLIELDMLMWDHGMRAADGSTSPEQRPDADVNIHVHAAVRFSDQAMKLASFLRDANQKYATDYRAVISQTTTKNSSAFMDLIPTITLGENEHRAQAGAGWSPHWRQPTDVYSTYSDKDFRLGLNAVQTTFGAIAQLTGARLKR